MEEGREGLEGAMAGEIEGDKLSRGEGGRVGHP